MACSGTTAISCVPGATYCPTRSERAPDRAIDRGGDRGIAEVQFGLPFDGPAVLGLRQSLVAKGYEDRHLALRGEQGRLVMAQLGRGLVARRAGLLGPLHRSGAGGRQGAIALGILLGEAEPGFGRLDRRLGLDDLRGLQADARFQVMHGRDRGSDVRMGLLEARAQVAVVDPGQNLPGLNGLVVLDENRRSDSPAPSGRRSCSRP